MICSGQESRWRTVTWKGPPHGEGFKDLLPLARARTMLGNLFTRLRSQQERPAPPASTSLKAAPAGVKTVSLESYRDWQIEVAQSPHGILQRDSFQAVIQPIKAGQQECLTGFPTPQDASLAARKRIDLLSISASRHWHGAHAGVHRHHRS